MRKLFLIFIILFSANAFSQEFATIGTKWYYNQGDVMPSRHTYRLLESVSDTIINGTECKKITQNIESPVQYNLQTKFMYSSNDSVFFYAGGDFHLLYDFGANTGDTIILDYFGTMNGESLKMIIDSTGTIVINGTLRKIQYISCGDGTYIEFYGPVIEGIGSVYFMFPTYDMHTMGPLRCYEDHILGVFKNPFNNGGWTEACDYIYTTGINDISLSKIKLIPNPVLNSFKIANLKVYSEYRITDLSGKLLMLGEVEPNQEINISSLSPGIYIFQLILDSERIERKVIKI